MTSNKGKQKNDQRGGVTCRFHGNSGCTICAQLPPKDKQ